MTCILTGDSVSCPVAAGDIYSMTSHCDLDASRDPEVNIVPGCPVGMQSGKGRMAWGGKKLTLIGGVNGILISS